jgi:hypothetical protein
MCSTSMVEARAELLDAGERCSENEEGGSEGVELEPGKDARRPLSFILLNL